jgi:hypothetical protein
MDQVRKTYQEPMNIFAISVGFSGSGKSQAYRMTIREPLQTMDAPIHKKGFLRAFPVIIKFVLYMIEM